jgi:hypothetical protein
LHWINPFINTCVLLNFLEAGEGKLLPLPTECEPFRAIAEEAFNQWAPGAVVKFALLKPGFSGSVLLRADIRTSKGSKVESGQYILKLSHPSKWVDQEDEIIAHKRAYNWNESYSQLHLPFLVKEFSSTSGFAMLLEIAGRSLDRYVTTDARESGAFLGICGRLVTDLLNNWSLSGPTLDQRPDEVLGLLSSYRLNQADAPSFHSYVNEVIGDASHFVVSGEVLLNPLKFAEFAKQQQWEASPTFETLVHGDLHGGNIMVNRMQPVDSPYWLIDFALSKKGLVGYDEAYMELANCLLSLGDENLEILIGALRYVEYPQDRLPIPSGGMWTATLLKEMRNAVAVWRDATYPQRLDEFDRQLALCRVAAGINWANKPLKGRRRHVALCYAGWAAKEYVKLHQPSAWAKLWQQPSIQKVAKLETDPADEKLWTEFWQAIDGFGGRHGRYVLLSESLGDFEDLRALGQLPWSAIIDLDPKSDKSGLHRHASPILGARRGLHIFSSTLPVADPGRGAAWMMASGWTLKGEHYPDYNEWKYARLQTIRDFIKKLEDASRPDPIHVVVLPGHSLDPATPMARIGAVVGAIDEATQGRASIYLMGRRHIPERISKLHHVPIDSIKFVHFIARTFGTKFIDRTAEVPGQDGKLRSIPLDLLRAMQENFHLLHSSILEEPTSRVLDRDAFWRGRPPNWTELNDGIDVIRDIHRDLMQSVNDRLESYRNHTVVLSHTPGAGGTTVALRVAWEARSNYPTAVLHKYSPSLKDRVRDLFHLTERPVLLVAESSDLPETAREELYRYLAHENCRVVLLYVRRVFSAREGNVLTGPMAQPEARRFCDSYGALTLDAVRLKQLEQITSGQGSLENYRVPFFYGLITFERDFLGVEGFVGTHLASVRRVARDMLEYLALVTIFSNSGIPENLLKQMMGISVESALSLSELLGEGPARLVVERPGGYRLMHQMIAEQVLAFFRGGKQGDHWTYELASYATDFIRDAVAAAGGDSEVVLTLFRQMFVDRTTGSTDGVEDRGEFAPIVESLDSIDKTLGHSVLENLTKFCSSEPHFWTHLGRHQIYRLRRDYDKAEEYLTHAIGLSPNDAIHHHAYGLVLRSRLNESLRTASKTGLLAEVFSSVEPYFSRAAHEFGETLRIDPENIYGYITHAQMILQVARALKDASGVDTIALVGPDQQEIQEWLGNHISQAEDLLREASLLYGTLDQSNTYLTDCHADLSKLYGDLDRVVQLWEIANEKGTGSSAGRRALVNAYLARGERKWANLSESELRRIVTLMESNLRHGNRRDDDYRFWFEAYKLLPEFEIDVALGQLSLWTKRFSSWWAYYYIYVLNFVLWFRGRTEDTSQLQEALEQCQKRHIGRKNASSLWYGNSGNESHLVSEHDLGSWSRKVDFWNSPEALRRVNGVIEETINGPQAGHIRIDGRTRVFFVPGKGFSPHKDENKPVNFFLGFSPVGLRAWSVEHGHVVEGGRINSSRQKLAEPVFVDAPKVPDEIKADRARKLRLDRVLQFADDLIRSKSIIGANITVSELADRVDAAFAVSDCIQALGTPGWEALLAHNSDYLLAANGSVIEVSLAVSAAARSSSRTAQSQVQFGQIRRYDPAGRGYIRSTDGQRYWFRRNSVVPPDRSKLANFRIVSFLADKNDKGLVASGVRILEGMSLSTEGIVSGEDLNRKAADFVRLEAGNNVQGVSLADLSKQLMERFEGFEPLQSRLAAKSIASFVVNLEGIALKGRPPTQRVGLDRTAEFGRLPTVDGPSAREVKEKIIRPSKKAEAKPTESPVRKLLNRKISVEKAHKADPIQIAFNIIRDSKQRSVAITTLGHKLAIAIPGNGKLASRIGFRSVDELARLVPGTRVLGEGESRKIELVQTESATFEDVKQDILRLIELAGRRGEILSPQALGVALSAVYPGEKTINKRLGYSTLVKMLARVSEIEVLGEGTNRQIVCK